MVLKASQRAAHARHVRDYRSRAAHIIKVGAHNPEDHEAGSRRNLSHTDRLTRHRDDSVHAAASEIEFERLYRRWIIRLRGR